MDPQLLAFSGASTSVKFSGLGAIGVSELPPAVALRVPFTSSLLVAAICTDGAREEF
jgi:hypothetical protein